MSAFTIVLV